MKKHEVRAILTLVDRLKALGDVTRLKILKLVSHQEYCVCELAEIIGMSQPGISQHLRKLRLAGFVTERREGQWSFYRANLAAVAELEARLRQFFHADLAAIADMTGELERVQELARNPGRFACRNPKNSAANTPCW